MAPLAFSCEILVNDFGVSCCRGQISTMNRNITRPGKTNAKAKTQVINQSKNKRGVGVRAQFIMQYINVDGCVRCNIIK